MNKKAEAFIKYLDDKKITCFAIEQISEDKLNTVVFRSHIVVEGQRLACQMSCIIFLYSFSRCLMITSSTV